MATLGTAYIQIVPSTEGISGSITSAFSGEAQSAGTKTGSSFASSLVGSAGKALVAGGTAIVAGVSAVVTATASAANATASYGDEIDKTSQKLQVSASQYQTMAFAAEHCGFETSVLTTAQRNLSQTDFNGNLYDALQTVMSLGTEEERTAMATELFGTKAAQQMQALLQGDQTMDEYMSSLDAMGGLMSDDAVSACATYEDSLTDLQTTFSGLKNNLMGEMLPSITEVMDGLTKLMSGDDSGLGLISQGISDFMSNILNALPTMVQTASSLIQSLLTSITSNMPMIVDLGVQIVQSLVTAIITNLPAVIDGGVQLVTGVISGIVEMLPEIGTAALDLVTYLLTSIGENLPSIVSSGCEMIVNMANGMLEGAPSVITNIGDILNNVLNELLENMPQMMENGFTMITNLASGIVKNLPAIVAAIASVIAKLLATITSNLPQILAKGVELLGKLLAGIIQAIPQIPAYVSQVFSSIRSAFGGMSWSSIGKNIMSGILGGIRSMISTIISSVKSIAGSILSAAKSALGIKSPSRVFRDQVGKNIALGLAEGMTDNVSAVEDAMDILDDATMGSISTSFSASATQNSSVFDLLSKYLPQLAEQDIYLDSGALVGGTAAKMDKALGSLSAVAVRGCC